MIKLIHVGQDVLKPWMFNKASNPECALILSLDA